MKNLSLVLFALIMIAGCSSAKVRILPGEKGVNTVISSDYEQDDAEEAMVDKANDYCKDQGKHAIFLNTGNSKYTGKMDEGARNGVRKAGRVAGNMGLYKIGGISDALSDRDYRAESKFKCE